MPLSDPVFSLTVIKERACLKEKASIHSSPQLQTSATRSFCLSQINPAESAEARLRGQTHTMQPGQIWMAPVKKVNPKSLAGARKSERDGPDSQSAQGSRLSACEQVQIHQTVWPHPPSSCPLILFPIMHFFFIMPL